MNRFIGFIRDNWPGVLLGVAGLVGIGGVLAFFGTLVGLCWEYPVHMGFMAALCFYLGVLTSYLFGKLSAWRRRKAIRNDADNIPQPMRDTLREMLESDGLAYTGPFEGAGDYEALERLGLVEKFSEHADAMGSAGWMVKPEVRKALKRWS